MTRTLRVAINALTNYGRFAIAIIVFFLLTPFIIDKLGPDDFGLWSLIFSVIGFLGQLDLGFGTAVVKYVAECKGAGDVERRNQLLSTLAIVYFALAVIAAAGVVALSLFFDRIFAIPADQQDKALRVLWIIATRAVVLNLPLSLFKGILFGEQKIHLLNLVQAVSTILYGLAAWFILDHGFGLITLAWVNLGAMVIEHIAYVFLAYIYVRDLKISFSMVRGEFLKEAFSFSLFTFIVSVSALILLRTDPIIVKLFLPLSAVAVYAVALKISEYSHLLTKQFINVLSPLVAELKGSGEDEKIRFLLVNVTKFALVPAAVLTVAGYALGREAIVFWVGPKFSGSWPVLALLMTAMMLAVPQMVASNVLTMTGHHKFTAYAAIASMFINIGLSLALVRPLNLVGVALGTLVATVIVDVVVIIGKACRLHGVSLGSYIRRVGPAALLPGGCQLAVTLALKKWMVPSSLIQLALLALPGVVVYGVVFWLLCVEPSEKLLLRQNVLQFSNRKTGQEG
jgi:O-antigen/teichoic acid export membrane protein